MSCESSNTSPNTDAPDIEAIKVSVRGQIKKEKPEAPTTKKKDIFDEEKYKEIDEKSSKIKVTKELTYEELVTTLTKDMKSELEKLRAIFYFVGSQDIEKQYYPGVTDPHTPRGYMKLIKLKKGHYSGFFALLCRAANLPCMILHGKGKSVGYEVGDKDIGDLNSSWNAVYVDDHWRLIHPHWAFTGVRGYNSGRWTKIEENGQQKRERAEAAEGIQVSRIHEYWFMPDPDQFVYFCIAKSPKWQLLEKPWMKETFVDVPYFQVPYFTKSEMTLSSSHKAVLTSEEGKVEITFDHDDSCTSNITYQLFFDVNESKGQLPNINDLPRCVLFESTEKLKRFIYKFPVVGVYKTMLFCGGTAPAQIVSFKIECKEASSNRELFLPNPTIGYGYGHIAKENGLLAPSEIGGVVQIYKNKPNEFNFQLDRKQNIEAKLCHNDFTSQELQKYIKQETQDDRLNITVEPPEHKNKGDFALQIFTETGNVLNYLLTDRKDAIVSGKEKERNQLKMQLEKAMEGNDPDQLEKAMNEFEEAKIEDKEGDIPVARKRLQELSKNNQLKMQLEKAMEGNDPDQLEKAMNEFEEAKIEDKEGDIPVARKRLQELSKNNQLKMPMEKAMEGNDPDQLEKAMNEFEEAKIEDKEGDIPVARKRLQELSKNNRLMVQLKKAIEGDNPDWLGKAMDQFDKAKIIDMAGNLPEARKRLQKRLMVQLKKAIEGDNPDRLEKAMDQFQKAKINDMDGDLPKARKRLQNLRKNNRLMVQLKKAIEGDNPDWLGKAMDQFEKAKIIDMAGNLPKARKRLQELRKNNRLMVQLKKAIEGDDPDRLEKAMDQFEKAKIIDMDDNLPKARKRLQELRKNNRLMVQLKKAIEGDDPDRLEKAMDQFEKAKIIDMDDNLPKARKRLQELRKNNRLMVQLKKAIEGDDPDLLEKAMDQFEKAKIIDMDGNLPKARKRLQELRKNNRLMVQLKKAIEGDDPDRLEKAVDQFEKAKIIDMDGNLPKARKRLQELRKNNRLMVQLKKAIEGDDPDRLEKAVDQFEKAKIIDMDGNLPKARKRLQELRKNNRLMVQLKKAIEGDDPDRLEKAVDQFEKAKIYDMDGNLPKARKRLQELRKNNNAKHRLKKAMKGRNVRELEAAIDECESAGIPDDDSDLVAAKKRLRDMQDNSNRHMEDSEKAITQCEQNGLCDDDDVIRGRQLLVELYEKAMEQAMKSRNELQRLKDSAKVSPVAVEINRSYVMPKAERFLRQQPRLQACLGVVLELKASTVSEIHRYSKPHIASYQAVVATYLILGEDMANLKRWNDVRNLLRMNGQRGIIRRIKKFNMDDLDDKGAKKANKRLDRYTLDKVKFISAAAAAFYIWSSKILMEELASEDTIEEEEDEERDEYEESNTSY